MRWLQKGPWIVLAVALIIPASRAQERTVSYQCADLITVVGPNERCPHAAPVQTHSGVFGMSADAERARQAAEAAAQNLRQVQEFMNGLDGRLRTLLDTLDAGSRQSLVALAQSVASRFASAAAARADQEQRLQELRTQLAAFNEELARLQREGRVLVSDIASLREQLSELEPAIAARRERLVQAQFDQEALTEILNSAWDGARRARTAYWAEAGDFFRRSNLGKPRDFTPEVRYAAASARRGGMTIDRRLIPRPVPNTPLAAQSLAGAANIALLRGSVASPIAGPVARNDLRSQLRMWSDALEQTDLLQQQADSLEQAVDRAMTDQRLRAEAVAGRAREAGRLEERLRSTQEENAVLSVQLNSAVARVKERFEGAWEAARQWALWEVARNSLQHILTPVAGATIAVDHFAWVVRQYGTFFKEDLPTAIELLGPNPSPEALERYERLTELSTDYAKEYAITLFTASLDEPSLPNQKKWQRLADGGYETAGGLRFGPTEWRVPNRGEGANRLTNGMLHVFKHTDPTNYEPQLARHIKEPGVRELRDTIRNQIQDRSLHGMFDGKPKEVVALVEEAWQRAQAGQARVLKTEDGVTTYLVNMGRRVGFQDGKIGRAEGLPAAEHMILSVKDRRNFVTSFPCVERHCLGSLE